VESTATPVGQVRLIEPCRTCNRLDCPYGSLCGRPSGFSDSREFAA